MIRDRNTTTDIAKLIGAAVARNWQRLQLEMSRG